MSHASLLLTVLLLVLSATRPMYAGAADTSCGIIWDEPILLSDTNYNAHSPKIALSGDDTVHIVWYGGGTRLPYRRSANGGWSFGQTTELLTDSVVFPYDANRPSVVAWQQNVYAFFQGATPGIYSPVRMVKSTTGGETWQYPVDISPDTTGPPPLTPTILGDTIVMTYEPRGEPLPWILRSTDAGVTWENVSSGVRIFHRLALGPRVTPSAGGVLHLVQLDASTGDTQYRRSHDLGDTWVQETLLSTVGDGFGSLDPTIAAGTSLGDNTVIAAWRDGKYGCLGFAGCSIIGRSGIVGPDSTAWVPERVLTSIPRGFAPSLSVHNRRVAAGWPMDQNIGQSNPPFAEVRVSSDTSWCSIFDPTTNLVMRRVVRVSVALSSKAVHVVWSASQAPDPSTFRIFYRRGVFKTTSVRDDPHQNPQGARLEQNYPNPFNPTTTISFFIPHSSFVIVKVYDLLGREVATLVNEKKEPGEHTVEWNPSTSSGQMLPSGVYYYRLIAGDRIETRKAILLK